MNCDQQQMFCPFFVLQFSVEKSVGPVMVCVYSVRVLTAMVDTQGCRTLKLSGIEHASTT